MEWVLAEPSTDAQDGTGRRRLRRHAKGFAWTGFDQALSAVSNVVISLALVRSGGAEALGIFTVAFAAYLIVLGFLRALLSEPVLTIPVEPTGVPDEAERFGVTTAVTYLLPASLIIIGVGVLAGGFEIVLIGLVLPLVALQDFFRYLFFRRGRPELAALLDGAWVVTSVIGWPLIASRGSLSVALVVWATGGALGVVIGFAVTKVRFGPIRRSLAWWWRGIRPLGGFLALSGIIFTLFSQITILGLAAILGAADLGTLRSVQIVLGPVGLVLTAFTVFALPRLSTSSARHSMRVAWLASGGAVVLAATSTIVLWLLAPVLVPLLFGEELEVPRLLVLAVGARTTLGALAMGPTLVLKARRRGAPIAMGLFAAGVVGVPVVLFVAANFGLVPAVWASNVGTLVNLLVLLLALRPTASLDSGNGRSAQA